MLNYIRSELYRARHNKDILSMPFIFGGLILLMNLFLYMGKSIEHFRYSSTSFSYSMIVSMPMIYCYVAADIAAVMYEGDRKNGIKKNSIAWGGSRTELLAARCIVSLITAIVILALVLPVYIVSAVILLTPGGPVLLEDVLMELPAVFLCGIASLILAVVLMELFDKSIFSVLTWIGIMVVLPVILLLAGELLGENGGLLTDIAMWMPQNFFSSGVGMQVTMSLCEPVWNTAAGMARCLIAGGAGILIFGGAGALLIRKKEY